MWPALPVMEQAQTGSSFKMVGVAIFRIGKTSLNAHNFLTIYPIGFIFFKVHGKIYS